jgi:hypothetical protein
MIALAEILYLRLFPASHGIGRGDMPIEPSSQVGQNSIALGLVEHFVIEPFVKMKCLVGAARISIKRQTAGGIANLVLAAVQDQQRDA